MGCIGHAEGLSATFSPASGSKPAVGNVLESCQWVASSGPAGPAWFNFSSFAGPRSWVAGVELATASKPPTRRVQRGGRKTPLFPLVGPGMILNRAFSLQINRDDCQSVRASQSSGCSLRPFPRSGTWSNLVWRESHLAPNGSARRQVRRSTSGLSRETFSFFQFRLRSYPSKTELSW